MSELSFVRCENPTIIVNPKLPELLYRYRTYFIAGRMRRFPHRKKYLVDFDYREFNSIKRVVTVKNINDYYVVDEETGETFPIFYAVPCGKCNVCKDAKSLSIVHRCEMESQCYNVLPWFVTLTYKPSPFFDNCPHVRHLQLFFKRLRRNLERNGYKEKIRYFAVSEYGKEKNRVHYHLIIWNLCPQKIQGSVTLRSWKDLCGVLHDSWKLGRTQCSLIHLEREDDGRHGIKYVAKYITKDENVPDGFPPNIVLSSRGHGGIGAHFIDSKAKEIRRTLNTGFTYINKFNQSLHQLVFTPYVINRVFPSFCRTVSLELRKAVVRSVELLAIFKRYAPVKYYDFFPYTKAAIEFYRRHMFAPWELCSPKKQRYTVDDMSAMEQEWKECYACMYQHQGDDWTFIHFSQMLRERFLGELRLHVQPYDISDIANKSKYHRALMHERQIL